MMRWKKSSSKYDRERRASSGSSRSSKRKNRIFNRNWMKTTRKNRWSRCSGLLQIKITWWGQIQPRVLEILSLMTHQVNMKILLENLKTTLGIIFVSRINLRFIWRHSSGELTSWKALRKTNANSWTRLREKWRSFWRRGERKKSETDWTSKRWKINSRESKANWISTWRKTETHNPSSSQRPTNGIWWWIRIILITVNSATEKPLLTTKFSPTEKPMSMQPEDLGANTQGWSLRTWKRGRSIGSPKRSVHRASRIKLLRTNIQAISRRGFRMTLKILAKSRQTRRRINGCSQIWRTSAGSTRRSSRLTKAKGLSRWRHRSKRRWLRISWRRRKMRCLSQQWTWSLRCLLPKLNLDNSPSNQSSLFLWA